MHEITAMELKSRMDEGHDMMIVDVREPYELEVCPALPGALAVPLGQVVVRAGELDAGRDVVVMCRSGGRSAMAIAELRHLGYTGNLINLKGGILAWADVVAASVLQ